MQISFRLPIMFGVGSVGKIASHFLIASINKLINNDVRQSRRTVGEIDMSGNAVEIRFVNVMNESPINQMHIMKWINSRVFLNPYSIVFLDLKLDV